MDHALRRAAACVLAVLVVPPPVQSAPDPPVRDVRVINEPGVHVVNEPTVNARSLPHKQPFQRSFAIEIPSGTLAASQAFSVPAGKRLVIEWVSGTTRVAATELVRMTLSTTASDEFGVHQIAPSVYKREFPGTEPPITPDFVVAFSQTTKLYADPGSSVGITVIRSEVREITPTVFGVSVSGYLVDCGGDPECPIP
jgi:hypothetical protein